MCRAGEAVLQLHRRNRQAVDVQHDIDASAMLRAVLDLLDHGQDVRLELADKIRIERRSRFEEAEAELDAGHKLQAAAENIQCPAILECPCQLVEQRLFGLPRIVVDQLGPFFRLRAGQELYDKAAIHCQSAVMIRRLAPSIAVQADQLFD